MSEVGWLTPPPFWCKKKTTCVIWRKPTLQTPPVYLGQVPSGLYLRYLQQQLRMRKRRHSMEILTMSRGFKHTPQQQSVTLNMAHRIPKCTEGSRMPNLWTPNLESLHSPYTTRAYTSNPTQTRRKKVRARFGAHASNHRLKLPKWGFRSLQASAAL